MKQKAVSVTTETSEKTASVTREHNFIGGHRGNLSVEEFRRDRAPPVREKRRVDTRSKRRETTMDCRRQE